MAVEDDREEADHSIHELSEAFLPFLVHHPRNEYVIMGLFIAVTVPSVCTNILICAIDCVRHIRLIFFWPHVIIDVIYCVNITSVLIYTYNYTQYIPKIFCLKNMFVDLLQFTICTFLVILLVRLVEFLSFKKKLRSGMNFD